jgi:hypothetical protein
VGAVPFRGELVSVASLRFGKELNKALFEIKTQTY